MSIPSRWAFAFCILPIGISGDRFFLKASFLSFSQRSVWKHHLGAPLYSCFSDICIQVTQLMAEFCFDCSFLDSVFLLSPSGTFAGFRRNEFHWRKPKEEEKDQAERGISATELNTLLCLYPWSINVVVYHDPSGRNHLGIGLALRCFQRLSFPDIATQQCR